MLTKPHEIDSMNMAPHILLEIGRVAHAHGRMEDELNGFISDLLGAGVAAGRAVTFTMRNITDRMSLARALAKIKGKDDSILSNAEAVFTKIYAANCLRNRFAHWGIAEITFNIDPDEHEVKLRKKNYRIKDTDRAVYKTKEIRDVADNCFEAAKAMSACAYSYRVAIGAKVRRS